MEIKSIYHQLYLPLFSRGYTVTLAREGMEEPITWNFGELPNVAIQLNREFMRQGLIRQGDIFSVQSGEKDQEGQYPYKYYSVVGRRQTQEGTKLIVSDIPLETIGRRPVAFAHIVHAIHDSHMYDDPATSLVVAHRILRLGAA